MELRQHALAALCCADITEKIQHVQRVAAQLAELPLDTDRVFQLADVQPPPTVWPGRPSVHI
jgi:hypothetical protein